MNAYFISGMAADERVFCDIRLPAGYSIQHLNWINPVLDETLPQYAVRLSAGIDQSKPFILLGLSMGGMMAVEIAKILPPEKLILLSSVPLASHLPPMYHRLHKLGAYKLVSTSFLKNASVLKKFFGGYQPEQRKLLCKVIRESDPIMIKWAVKAIGAWDNEELPANYYHIHGNNDNVLPSKNTKPTHVIKGGRHFMVVERSGEINGVLGEILVG